MADLAWAALPHVHVELPPEVGSVGGSPIGSPIDPLAPTGSERLSPQAPLPELRIADLAYRLGLCKSKNDARRMIKQGAVRVGGMPVQDPKAFVDVHELRRASGTGLRISVGRKRHGVVSVRPTPES